MSALQGRRLTLADLKPREPAPLRVVRPVLRPELRVVSTPEPAPALTAKQRKRAEYWAKRNAFQAERQAQLELRKPEVAELTATLMQLYPGAFAIPVRPLKIGITEDILRDLGCDKKVLDLVMHVWCSSPAYRAALRLQHVRFGLDGLGAGPVAPPYSTSRLKAAQGTTMPIINLSAKSLKVTTVIDGAALADITVPDGVSRVPVKVQVASQQFTADFAAKSVRKTIAAIREHGAEQVAIVVQGKLIRTTIEDAGIAATIKTPKPL